MVTRGEPDPLPAQDPTKGENRSPWPQILTHPKAQEVLGILGIAVAIFLMASLISYDPLDPSFFNSGGGRRKDDT
jgi:hypothetical protein